MEINIIEESKNKMIFEIKGESHTLANLLKKELWNDKNVTAAGYHIKHPLIGTPKMVIETSGTTPINALEDAINRLKKKNKDFAGVFKRKVK
ncbi:hypothetical protein A3K72_02015 [Candidatus Woesearchaeota archaeon RBG_13_36_6]|nr:MAG: hypothetical protein A3K72_02015 [Candidatus Woesearchaeota archaeon RBG_13_36_6]